MGGRRLIAAVAASVLLSGCGEEQVSVPPSYQSPPPPPGLARWSGFPVGASPRPLVLTESTVIAPSKFRTSYEEAAFDFRQFTIDTRLPGDEPARWQQRPLITAVQALAELHRTTFGGPTPTSATLSMIAVKLGSATFSTDRGPRVLPAWQFSFAGVHDVASVLAIAPASRWPRLPEPDPRPTDMSATIAPDGNRATIRFLGLTARPGPCQTNYRLTTIESSSAVVITIKQQHVQPTRSYTSAEYQSCNTVAVQRTAVVKLDRALGGRVLIDYEGRPLPAS